MSRILSHRGPATGAFATALGHALAFGQSVYTPDREFVIAPDARAVWPIDPIVVSVHSAREVYAEWSQGFMEASGLVSPLSSYGVRLRLHSSESIKVIVDVVRF
jgi:hypothetical protein